MSWRNLFFFFLFKINFLEWLKINKKTLRTFINVQWISFWAAAWCCCAILIFEADENFMQLYIFYLLESSSWIFIMKSKWFSARGFPRSFIITWGKKSFWKINFSNWATNFNLQLFLLRIYHNEILFLSVNQK